MDKMDEVKPLPLKVLSLGAIRDVSAVGGLEPLPGSAACKHYMHLQWGEKEFEVAIPAEVYLHICERRSNFDSDAEMEIAGVTMLKQMSGDVSPNVE